MFARRVPQQSEEYQLVGILLLLFLQLFLYDADFDVWTQSSKHKNFPSFAIAAFLYRSNTHFRSLFVCLCRYIEGRLSSHVIFFVHVFTLLSAKVLTSAEYTKSY